MITKENPELYAAARYITLKYGGGSKNWKEGDRVMHPDGYEVEIAGGCYLDPIYGRLSNWWQWQRVNPDGTYGELVEGYGWDTEPLKK